MREREKDEESMRIGMERRSPGKTEVPKLYAYNEYVNTLCPPNTNKIKVYTLIQYSVGVVLSVVNGSLVFQSSLLLRGLAYIILRLEKLSHITH